MAYVYLDLETAGLNVDKHDIVEVAWAVDDGPINSFVPEHDITCADPAALRYNGYHDRGLNQEPQQAWDSEIVDLLLHDLSGNSIIGLNPVFAAKFLRGATNRRFHHEPWYHVLLDLSTYAAGLLGWDVPCSSHWTVHHVRETLGFKIPYPDHSAAGDVDTARELHRALLKLARVRREYDIAKETQDMRDYLTWRKEREHGLGTPVTTPRPYAGTSFTTGGGYYAAGPITYGSSSGGGGSFGAVRGFSDDGAGGGGGGGASGVSTKVGDVWVDTRSVTVNPGDTVTVSPGAITWTATLSPAQRAIDIIRSDDDNLD